MNILFCSIPLKVTSLLSPHWNHQNGFQLLSVIKLFEILNTEQKVVSGNIENFNFNKSIIIKDLEFAYNERSAGE